MTYARQAVNDLERLTDFLLERDPVAALKTSGLIEEAITILERHPLLGRRVEQGFRELVISRGRSGYLALYDYDGARDVVTVYAIRHQREADYKDGANEH